MAKAKKTTAKKTAKASAKKAVKAPAKKASAKKDAAKKAPAKKAAKASSVKTAKKASVKKAGSKSKKTVHLAVAPAPNGHRFKAAPFMANGKAKAAQNAKKHRGSKLTPKDIKVFHAMLLEKRQSLIGDLSDLQAGSLGRGLSEAAGDLSTAPTHPADLGTDNFEQEFTLGLMESERALLNEIDEALDRIDSGEYGICLGTGKPIARARLLARPWCKYSIEYKRLLEQGLIHPEDEEDEDDADFLDDDEMGEDIEDDDAADAGDDDDSTDIEEEDVA